MDEVAGTVYFTYGRSYVRRDDAIPLYLPELPLRSGRISPLHDLSIASCLRDAGPDAWGQRVILVRRIGHLDPSSDTGALSVLTYLLESGSDRIGALDFQRASAQYVPRSVAHLTLAEMQLAADRLTAGETLAPVLAEALLRGTSIGGARPKVTLLDEAGQPVIAKLSTQSDTYAVVKFEAVAMALAGRVGIRTARTRLTECMGRDVLLVDRFDRPGEGRRTLMVSALTILGLDEFTGARYASYLDLADQVRARFRDPTETLAELFRRVVLNICVSNTDDHARNHAAFWDGTALTLTPAYDISPSLRSGDTATQAMALTRDGRRDARLALCRETAKEYLLRPAVADAIIDEVVSGIEAHFDDIARQVGLTDVEHAQLWRRLVLHPSIHYDA
jgi:serine/threonine-protein kinase HipA